jgi:TolA-binding protein
MAKRVKFSQKEIKSPDEFRKSISNIIQFTSDSYIKFIIGVGVIVIVIIATFSIKVYHEKRDVEANSKFKAAIGYYNSKDVDKALSEFTNVKDNYPGSEISNIALYYIGLINFDNGNYDEAIGILNEFLSVGDTDTILKDAANYTIGVANFKKGNWQPAIDSFSGLNADDSPYGKQAQLLLGIALEKQGKRGEAEKIYEEVITSFPDNNLTF